MKRKRLLSLLLVIALVLAAGHAVNAALDWPSWFLRFLFDMDRENTIQAWFSTILWLLCAQKSFACSRMKISSAARPCWNFLSAIFLLGSLDESAMIHERFGVALYKYLRPYVSEGVELHSHWLLALVPFIVLAGFAVCRAFLRCFKEFPGVRRSIWGGFVLVLLGAVVLEALMIHDGRTPEWLVQTEIVIEETLEMLGVILLLSGLMRYQALGSEEPGNPG